MKTKLLREYLSQLFRHAGNVFTLVSLALAVAIPLLPIDSTAIVVLPSLAAVASVLAASFLTWRDYRPPDLEIDIRNCTLAIKDGWLQLKDRAGFSLSEAIILELSVLLSIHNNSQHAALVALHISSITCDWPPHLMSSLEEVNTTMGRILLGTHSRQSAEIVGKRFRIPPSFTADVRLVGQVSLHLASDPLDRRLPPVRTFSTQFKVSDRNAPPLTLGVKFDTATIKTSIETAVVNQIRDNETVKRNHYEPQLLAIPEGFASR